MSHLETLISARAEKLQFYAPYYFIREIEASKQMQEFIYRPLQHFEQDLQQQVIAITVEAEEHLFFVKYLSWDSNFFQRPVYKLVAVLFNHQDYLILKKAVWHFKEQFFVTPHQYTFIEIPAEDTLLIQALNANGFLMIETRLTYFRTVAGFSNERYAVRNATIQDIESVREVATGTRNPYDRFHAEPAFSQTTADAFLGKYAEEAVRGYCDLVLVPDEGGVSNKAFLALGYLTEDSHQLNCKVSRIVLTAVSPACKGWHYKLMSEALYRAKFKEVDYIFITTQATNKPAIRNCEKLAFNLGGARHILSFTASLT